MKPLPLFVALSFAVCVGSTPASLSAQVAESAEVRTTTSVPEEDVRSTINQLAYSLNIPGFAVAIFDDDSVVFRQTTGTLSESTRFYLGSLTKVLTATLVMRLVERTKLRLDAPAREYLPFDLPKQTRVADLLHHRTGIPRNAGYASWNGGSADLESRIERLDLDPSAHPFEYSNLNYELVGEIVENVTESSYAEALERDLLQPLGMDRTSAPRGPSEVSELAAGHQYAFGFPVRRTEGSYYEWEIPSRFVTSTLSDMVRIGQLHLAEGVVDGTRLLEETHVRRIRSRPDGEKAAHVMGWFTEEVDGRRILRHDGITQTHHTSMALIPQKDVGVVVFGNINSYAAGAAGMLAESLALMAAGEPTDALSNFEFVLRLALGVALFAFLLLFAIRVVRWAGYGFPLELLPGAWRRVVPAATSAALLVALIPWYCGVPLIAIAAMQPDLAVGLVAIPASGALSVLLGALTRAARARADETSDGDTS